MKVVIVGAGEVGSYLAARLTRENHHVVVVEQDAERALHVEQHIDAHVVTGSGSHPDVMAAAGIRAADLLVAVTTDDEANLVACMLARQAGVERRIARIEAAALRAPEAADLLRAAGADEVIDPDAETAVEILHLLDYPGATEINMLADDRVAVVGTVLGPDSPLVGRPLSESFAPYGPDWEFLIGAVSRGDRTVIPRRDMVLQSGDVVRIVDLGTSSNELRHLLGLTHARANRVMLLGGGRTGEMVAERLVEMHAEVCLVERDPERARELAETLDDVLILEGDITDAELLEEERVGDHDAVIAVTGNDEDNILACLYAKSMGVPETIALLHRLEFLPLLRTLGIDGALSPRTACANGVMRIIRGGVQVATYLDMDVEVLEMTVADGSGVHGQRICDLHLPKEVLIAAVVRDGTSMIGRGHTVLQEQDHLVVFARPKAVAAARKRFE
ncbi:MAG: Trk system potassium transporter TrkA [bacterium]|nr:Trk system potassium transporter TrkA [bacterium]MXV90056.1 Trk system potassium transporter TrkA [Acidimicrobiia bacterium]MYC46514.1 Trk system potassium transporter TrkA [Acidimicrobiia bacterium]MYI19167.1 Trk system potassium transporter TrkA [Acidimicrobiia bacterium]